MKLINKLTELEPKLKGDIGDFKNSVSELYTATENDKERNIISEFIENVLSENSQQLAVDIQLLRVKAQLLDKEDILPMSYIARTYFKKSRSWLSQRIGGNIVNGKRARFTEDELKTFSFALQDISKEIGSITIL